METSQPFVGIDVSSQRLDVDTVPVSQPFSEPNNEDGLPVVITNPKNVRHFAKAIGRLAKTDKLDAQVLALYAERVHPPVQPLRDQEQLELANLMTRRRQLQGMIVMEENRRRTCTPQVRANIDLSLAHLRRLLIQSCSLTTINDPIEACGGGDQFSVVFQGD